MEQLIRTTSEIRQGCIDKLANLQAEPSFVAVVACLLGQPRWTSWPIDSLSVDKDGVVLAQYGSDVHWREKVGMFSDLVTNIIRVAEFVGLDPDERGYLIGRVARIRRTK